MDANGTRYQLLLGRSDWLACSADEARPGAAAVPLSEALDASRSSAFPLDENEASHTSSNLNWHDERHELTLQKLLYRFPPPPKQTPQTLAARRGAARDRYGNWYWIAATGLEILINSAGTKKTSHFWAASDGVACPSAPGLGNFRPRDEAPALGAILLNGLAITEDHYLVVGVLDPQGLLVFDLHAGGQPTQMRWPVGVDFQPFDLAPAPGGGVWILDREHRRYWGLDRYLRVLGRDVIHLPPTGDIFYPRESNAVRRAAPCTLPREIVAADAFPLDANDPIAVEGLPDGTVLILDRVSVAVASKVRRYRLDEPLGDAVDLMLDNDIVDLELGGGLAVVAHDFAFVAEHRGTDGSNLLDRLYVATAQGDQSFVFLIEQKDDQLHLKSLADYLPMRLFGGRGVVRGCHQAFYDSGDRWVPLAVQHRPQYAEEADVFTPSELTARPTRPPGPLVATRRPPLDGREPGCVWHRVMLDAYIPPETKVKVWSRAADDPRELIRAQWQAEPHLHLRKDGSELPFVAARTAPGDGTWELLLQRARGRYIQLKLRLSGNGQRTPRLRALRVYYPRFSYLDRYLPAVYREDRESASFLDRFLANPEGTLTTLEDKIASVQMLFDPASAPAQELDWLAQWFGIALDPQWDDRRRRLFLKNGMKFFQYRGTVRGLQMALNLVLDGCADASVFADMPAAKRPQSIRIVERFRMRTMPGVLVGDPSAGLLPARTATARWRPDQGGFALHQLFNQKRDEVLDKQDSAAARTDGFPISPPSDPDAATLWTSFSEATLGFIPSTADAHIVRWQDFLMRRYHAISVLNRTYGTTYAAFTTIPLPAQLPPDGAPLADWYQFQSVVVAMHRTAHRFTVLLPAPKEPDPEGTEHRRRMELTRRVIDLEKPAHTVFDVKFYWAFFRVGQARLGEDSIVDRGSRATELMPPFVLGRNYLAESYLAPGWPRDIPDRHIVGRDRLKR